MVGFTGPPGVGKSTLLAALTKFERQQEKTVAVLSIDPSSPFTHGALLGDRIRLSNSRCAGVSLTRVNPPSANAATNPSIPSSSGSR